MLKSEKKTEEKIDTLKRYLRNRDDIEMAFLFGSRAKGSSRNTSDWDIAVYLNNDNQDQDNEHEIWRDVENIVESEVDLVVLNRSVATVAWSAIRAGRPLVIKNQNQYLDFMFRVSDEANAWYETSADYYRVFERSNSLTSEDADRIRRLLTFLEEGVKEYADFKNVSQQQFLNDKSIKRNVEHWIEHMVVAVVDVAEIVLASEKKQMPTIYRELVIALGSVSPFNSDETCENIAKWVQLRNLLAHDYLDYRFAQITKFLNETEPFWIKFIDHTKTFVKTSS